MPDWYKTFFRGVALDFWNAAVDPLAAEEAHYLKKMLAVRKNARLLDVPCGNGRHALELARMGFRVTGVDLSKQQLSLARKAAEDSGVEVEFILRDKRKLDWKSGFAGACCCGNSFGYLDDGGMQQFVAGVARALKPKARFVLDTAMAAESIIPNLDETWWMDVAGVTVMISNHYEVANSRLHTKLRFLKNGRQETREIFHRVYTVAEITGLLRRNGIEVIALHADIHEKPYALAEPQLWVVAEKK